MGGGKGGFEVPEEFKALARMGLGQAQMVQPLMGDWVNWARQYATGAKNLEQLPVTRDLLIAGGPNRQILENQYRTARESVISGLPQGGVMQRELARLPQEKARTMAGMDIGARQGAAQMLLGGGPFISQTGIPMSTSGTQMTMPYGEAQMASSQAKGQAKGGLFGGLGQLIGLPLGGWASGGFKT